MKKRLFAFFLAIMLLAGYAVPVLAATPVGSTSSNTVTVQPGVAKSFNVAAKSDMYFAVQTTKAGQMIEANVTANTKEYSLSVYHGSGTFRSLPYCTAEPDIYYIRLASYAEKVSGTLTVTLQDNDTNEPNNTVETATPISDGDSVDFALSYEEKDWFVFETTKPGEVAVISMEADSDVDNLWVWDAEGNDVGYYWNNDKRICSLEEPGKYYIELRCYSNRVVTGTLTMSFLRNDTNEPNNTVETATPISDGETVNFDLEEYDEDWFVIETTKAGEFISVSVDADSNEYSCDFYSAANLNSSTGCKNAVVTTAEPGKYYIKLDGYNDTKVTGTLTINFLRNDDHEPNNIKEGATLIPDGGSVDFIVESSDVDWFAVETTKPGQDIKIDFTGFHYENEETFRMAFGGISNNYSDWHMIEKNGTIYFHAEEAGLHYIVLESDSNRRASNTMTVSIVDGDKNEWNDVKEQASNLPLSTDETFVMGGWGDEDWFRFEVTTDGSGNDLYTLRFLDLNPNYSDCFSYEVYDPSGNVMASGTEVNIHHSKILSCTQQGVYYVRVYLPAYPYNYKQTTTARSELRIRVDKGGADPYEPNNTWQTAAVLQPGQLTQHILAEIGDADWFRITVPEADMGLRFTTDRSTGLTIYTAKALAESSSPSGIYGNSATSCSCKLPDAGVYYLKLTTSSSYATEDLRSFTVELIPHKGEENNDTWDRAKQLYESVPQSYDRLSNDEDWFKLTVPAGYDRLYLLGGTGSVYREQDILQAGVNASNVSVDLTGESVSPGNYYIKASSGGWDKTIRYELGRASGVENAVPLEANVWTDFEYSFNYRYYDIGQFTAGDQIRVYAECVDGSDASVHLADENGNNKDWFYYNRDIFTIPADGTYCLKPSGHSRIRWEKVDSAVKATGIDGPDDIYLAVGQRYFLKLDSVPYNTAQMVQCSGVFNSDIAYWDDSYVVAEGPGTTVMKFYVRDGSKYIYKEINVHVGEELTEGTLTISGAKTQMTVGETNLLQASLAPAEIAGKVQWSSSDPSVVYVTDYGKTVAVGEGTATITANVGAVEDSVVITTTGAAPSEDQITAVLLDEYSMTMYMGEGTRKLTATVEPAGISAQIKWLSSNTAVATVDQTGVVTPKGPGISVITASVGGRNVSCIVTVQAPRVRVTGISFSEAKLQIPLGFETVLDPIIAPYNATTKTVTWVSDDESVAMVSRTGIVRAMAVGETVIRVTTLDGGFSAEITIEVTTNPSLGDINGDGYIDAGDAVLCLRSVVGLVKLTQQQLNAGDVNKDGFVDAGDAVRILRYNAGLIDTLE